MQILVNTDRTIDAEPDLVDRVDRDLAAGLARYADRLTRVEVHLSDQSAERSGAFDLRCALEARPAGQQPIAVNHSAATVDEAYAGALSKLRNLLDTRFGRIDARRGRESIRRVDLP